VCVRVCVRAKPIKLRSLCTPWKHKRWYSSTHSQPQHQTDSGPLYVPDASLLCEEPPSPTEQEAVWAPELLRTFRQKLVCTSHVCCARKALGSRKSLKGDTINISRDKWVPVTTAWRVLTLRMEERPPAWRVGANILNKQSRTADKGWPSSLGVGRGANNSSPQKYIMLRNSQRVSLGPGLTGTGSGHLWLRWWTFGFHKMRGISWLAENRSACQ